jgi:hypothetical protein
MKGKMYILKKMLSKEMNKIKKGKKKKERHGQ